MKVATHNLMFLFGEGEHAYAGQKWVHTKEFVDARIEHFGKLFAEIDADIVLLQEVASKNVIERIIARTGIDYSYFFATPDQSGVGNAVLYKQKDTICESIPATSSLPVFVEGDIDMLGPRIWSRRDFVHLETSLEGKKLHVVGIHIKANFLVAEQDAKGAARPMATQITAADGLIRSEVFRFVQAKKARALVDSFFQIDPEAQIIIGGDFNVEEQDSIFRIIRGEIKQDSDSLITVSQKVPEAERFSLSSKGKMRLIDHLLFSKSLEPRISDLKIFNKNISDSKNIAPSPTVVGSDHAPVVLELI